jgi:hypothetical protein
MSIEKEDVKYDKKNNFIIVNGRPSPSSDNIKQAFTQAIELSNKTNCKNILINGMDVIDLPSLSQIWRLSSNLIQQIKIISKLRVAYAISDKISSPFEFFEDYLANRGVPIQKFDNLNDAKAWLLE